MLRLYLCFAANAKLSRSEMKGRLSQAACLHKSKHVTDILQPLLQQVSRSSLSSALVCKSPSSEWACLPRNVSRLHTHIYTSAVQGFSQVGHLRWIRIRRLESTHRSDKHSAPPSPGGCQSDRDIFKRRTSCPSTCRNHGNHIKRCLPGWRARQLPQCINMLPCMTCPLIVPHSR